jgi:hypothetical protein
VFITRATRMRDGVWSVRPRRGGLQQVLSKARKFAKPDAKAAADDLEAKFDTALNEHDAEWVQRRAAASASADADKANAPANAPGADAPAQPRGKAKPKAAAAKGKGAKAKKAPVAAKRGARGKKRGSSSAAHSVILAGSRFAFAFLSSASQARTRAPRAKRSSARRR